MKSDVCDLYKLLHNPLRLEMLRRVYASRDGMNVGSLVDDLIREDVKQPCVSEYLKQLEKAGVIIRRRAGRYVNYFADNSNARGNVRRAVQLIVNELRRSPTRNLTTLFGVLMNPFRAAVVNELAKAGPMDTCAICTKFEHQAKYLKRDLKVAIDAGILAIDDTDDPTYSFIPPPKHIDTELIALCL